VEAGDDEDPLPGRKPYQSGGARRARPLQETAVERDLGVRGGVLPQRRGPVEADGVEGTQGETYGLLVAAGEKEGEADEGTLIALDEVAITDISAHEGFCSGLPEGRSTLAI
jgi:hypothetical protein